MLLVTSSVTASESVTVRGQITIAVEGLNLADAGAIVVFLEDLDGTRSDRDEMLPPALVRQNGARFDPPFLVVAKGQQVEMPNDDVIFHNVFSYSEPNDFDLGMYPSGQSRSLRFQRSGLVRIYCSIHEGMDGLIFVAPSHLFALPDPLGRYAISDVPPGRYSLHVWSERLPERIQRVEIAPGAAPTIDIGVGSSAH